MIWNSKASHIPRNCFVQLPGHGDWADSDHCISFGVPQQDVSKGRTLPRWWNFKHVLFLPLPGDDDPIWPIFFSWVVQPPASDRQRDPRLKKLLWQKSSPPRTVIVMNGLKDCQEKDAKWEMKGRFCSPETASWLAMNPCLSLTDPKTSMKFQTLNFGFFWKTNGCSLFFHANTLHVSYDHVFYLPTLDERWLHWWWNVGEVERWTLAHLGCLFSSRGQNQWCLVTPKQDALEDWRRHKSDRHMALAFEWMVETVHGGLELKFLLRNPNSTPTHRQGTSTLTVCISPFRITISPMLKQLPKRQLCLNPAFRFIRRRLTWYLKIIPHLP